MWKTGWIPIAKDRYGFNGLEVKNFGREDNLDGISFYLWVDLWMEENQVFCYPNLDSHPEIKGYLEIIESEGYNLRSVVLKVARVKWTKPHCDICLSSMKLISA